MKSKKPKPIHAKCPTCEASMLINEQHLTSGLVSTLIHAIEWVHANNRNRFHYLHDLYGGQRTIDRSYGPANNFKKLRYWGLITHADKDEDGYPIHNGMWLITTNGGRFLRGELQEPKTIWTFRNKRIPERDSPEQAGIDDFRGKVPEFQRDFATEVMPLPKDPPYALPPGQLL